MTRRPGRGGLRELGHPTIARVLARHDAPSGAVPLPRLAGWLGLGAFCAFLVIGLATRLAIDPARAAAGALIALAAAIPLFLLRTRLALGLAAASTAGVVLIGNGDSRVIGWMTVVVLAGWCVLAGGIAVGIVYGAASILLFGARSATGSPATCTT